LALGQPAAPRLRGLTDEEYFWGPVDGCWSIRATASGGFAIDYAYPEPVPAPFTTIAWRLGHVIAGCFGLRNASHFGGPPVDLGADDYPGTAAEALNHLDAGYSRWVAGVRSLGEQGLARPCGPAEAPFAALSMAALVLHIHREVLHHTAEISPLRALFAHRDRPVDHRPVA